jgi:hypothetical protein
LTSQPIPLENDFQRELNLPRSGSGARNPTKGCIRPTPAKGASRRYAKVGPVQNIKKLGPELNVSRLTYGKVLHYGEIKVGQSGH